MRERDERDGLSRISAATKMINAKVGKNDIIEDLLYLLQYLRHGLSPTIFVRVDSVDGSSPSYDRAQLVIAVPVHLLRTQSLATLFYIPDNAMYNGPKIALHLLRAGRK